MRIARCALVVSRELPSVVLTFALTIIALNLFDAFLTLWHIDMGAVELNPLMRSLLERGPLAFVAGKHLLVGACIVVVAAHCRHPPALGALRFVVLPVYAGVVIYQVALFAAA